ncbi:MAG: hypothetical protein A2W25_11415 [candidate division Zixibacteria bacterium RBG_16_53_22]|nr:MAG: hypothetical protein A2W25_11415 [candidate division Zixibacteria bacterium RBG_16_53_22]
MFGMRKDNSGAVNTAVLLGMVIFVLIAAVVYPLVGDRVADLTNESSENYVGASEADLVSMIPLFYWLAILLVVIGVAIVAIKDST